MQILTSIHFSNHGYLCIQTHCVQTHICLCPRECSHFEPLCIHAYIHKYSYFVWWTLLYKNPRCGHSHMSMPLRALTARTSLCAQILTSIHFFRSQILLYINPLCATPHMSMPLRVLTVRTSLYIHAYIHKYIVWCTHAYTHKLANVSSWILS